nr:hypothetical protein [Candidatus Freyarchaeota archaeon]
MSKKDVTDKIINKAKTFLSGIHNYPCSPDIKDRLGKIVSNMARTVGYRIANDPTYKNLESSPIKQELKKQIISEMVNQRVYERVKDKKEPLKVAEKLSQDIMNELKSLEWSTDKSKLFMEAMCIIYETGEKGIKVI